MECRYCQVIHPGLQLSVHILVRTRVAFYAHQIIVEAFSYPTGSIRIREIEFSAIRRPSIRSKSLRQDALTMPDDTKPPLQICHSPKIFRISDM